jgi:hypothetical protein
LKLEKGSWPHLTVRGLAGDRSAKLTFLKLKIKTSQVPGAHDYNPSYLGN